MSSELEQPLYSTEPGREAGQNRIESHALQRALSMQTDAQAAQALLAAIVESSDDAIVTKDLNGIITSWNKSAQRIFGYTAEEVIGKPVLILIPEDRKDEEPAILSRLRRGERVDHFETIRRRKDGSLLNISLTISPVKDAHGRIIGASKVARDISFQKNSQDASNFLAAIVQSSDDAIVTKDLNGIITSWNKGAERIFGYTPDEIIGQSVLMIIPPELHHEEPGILARIRSGQRIEHYETVRRRKDGSLLDISLTISPVRDMHGNIIGASKIARDITERKRRDEELAQRTRLLETLNRTGATLAGELDLEKLVQAVTDAGREIAGAEFGAFFYNVKDEKGESYTLYTISGVPREAFSKFPMPRNTAVFEPTFRGAGPVRVGDILKDPRYGKNEPHHGMPKGHLPVRSYLAVPVVSRTGDVLGGLFYGHSQPDVFTEEAEKTISAVAAQAALAIDNASLYRDLQRELAAHKAAESALRESEARFRTLIDNSFIPIWVKDTQGRYLQINKRYEEVFHVKETDIIGKKDADLFSQELAAQYLKNDETVMRTGKPFETEEIGRHPDGDHIYITIKFPLKDLEGRIQAVGGLAMDITDRKRNEKEVRAARENLARANEELDRRVQERTASLREVIAQMEEFSYSVSHDLRAPVRAMKGYAMAALEDYGNKLDDRGRDYIDRIIRSSTRMEGLIHDILTYSRVARAEINPQPVSLHRLIPDIVHQYPALQPPNAEIIIREPLHSVMAHEPSLMQAMSNLLNNAVKFVAPGIKPLVEVSTEKRKRIVRVWIKDNGIGIQPEYQHRLFGMFERIHQDSGYEGTGIGLAIVRKAVEKMNGRAGVESDGVHGSSFWIELSAASEK